MRSDVLPAPVGPTTRLSFPRLKSTSSAIRSMNVRLRVPPGVTLAWDDEEAAQVKAAWRIPIVVLCSSGTACEKKAEAEGCSCAANSSMSSVCVRS